MKVETKLQIRRNIRQFGCGSHPMNLTLACEPDDYSYPDLARIAWEEWLIANPDH